MSIGSEKETAGELAEDTDFHTPHHQETYADINLREYRGTIVQIGPQPQGGDCMVHWHKPIDVYSVQCLCHLNVHEGNGNKPARSRKG